MLLILSLLFSGIWSLFATYMVNDKPKTCWGLIALMSVIIYFLY